VTPGTGCRTGPAASVVGTEEGVGAMSVGGIGMVTLVDRRWVVSPNWTARSLIGFDSLLRAMGRGVRYAGSHHRRYQ